MTALARLTANVDVSSSDANDELVDVNEASRRLGVSASYLYHNSAKFTFTRRIGPRALRFSSNGIEKYITARR